MQPVFRFARSSLQTLVDFALPPRCAGCSAIVATVDTFCERCWPKLDFLRGGCTTCGIPLEATEADHCGACLASPPVIDRTRAVLGYDDTARQLALNLKYGRKVALARTMARYMDGLRGEWGDEAVIVPVPLHRRRLWWRGFNQAGLVARHLSRRWSLPVDNRLLVRRRPTRSLKGLTQHQRREAVRGAFAVRGGADVKGRTVVLIDDVLASGATSDGCARALRKAGAARVELVTWARVVRPAHLVR
ncbi:ComF family protein [Sphingomonas rhizophila]|uniref:ComF family protein n=1 Tax=Sphingomonas rhizophila TaxID=2071607 RepID=UPI001FE5EA6D|nr:ComF family protein [Sphingomonas rhizophila]